MIRFLFLVFIIFSAITVADYVKIERGEIMRTEDCKMPTHDYIIVGDEE